MNPAALLEIAHDAIDVGHKALSDSARLDVRQKGDRDTVTNFDLNVERTIRAYLAARTPEIGFLGEEEGMSSGNAEKSVVWTLDPIDGTANFVHGVPLSAISLALIEDGASTVAVIDIPPMKLRYSAVAGEGSFVNGDRLSCSRVSRLFDSMVSIGDYAVGSQAPQKNRRRLGVTTLLAERVERVRMFGSAAIDLAWVAEGRIDAAVILGNKPWDTAAGVLIAREAGALVLDASGRDHSFQSAETIAVSPGIADDLLKLIQG